MGDSAVTFRINELQEKIRQCDEEILQLDTQMEQSQTQYTMELSEKEASIFKKTSYARRLYKIERYGVFIMHIVGEA